jgi:hypothetical protein
MAMYPLPPAPIGGHVKKKERDTLTDRKVKKNISFYWNISFGRLFQLKELRALS